MSRNRVPTNVLQMRGSFNKHPERKKARSREPVPVDGIGEAPQRFTKRQRAIWDEIVGICAPGVLANSHRLALDELVLLEEKRRYCERMDPTDKRLWSSLVGRFGLTPTEMSRVSVPPGKGGNEFEDL